MVGVLTPEEQECRRSWHAAALEYHDKHPGSRGEWHAHQNLFFRGHLPDAHLSPAERYPHLQEFG